MFQACPYSAGDRDEGQKNVKLIQHLIYDEEDELIYPIMDYNKLSEGKIVEVQVSMEGIHAKVGLVSHH